MEKRMNVVFIADEGYVMPTCVAITSLIENRDPDYYYCIFVVMPIGTRNILKSRLKQSENGQKNVKIVIKEAGMEDLKELHIGENKSYLAATETALLKFKLPELFPNLDKILYLDGDIIVRDNLASLYETDLGEHYVAAVRDLPQVLYQEQSIGAEISGQEYFNSGVMLLNLKKMREMGCMQRLMEEKRKLENDSLMDQNIFNIVFQNSVIQLSFLYNACYINLVESARRYSMESLNRLYDTYYQSPDEIMQDIKVMHFSSKLKPWMFYDVPLADEWIYYYKKSAYKDIPLQRIWHTKRDIDKDLVKEKIKELTELPCENKKVIPIVFATNREYAPFVAVAIQSIYEYSEKEYFYDINILIDASMSNNLKQKFQRIHYENISIRMWDVRKCFEGVNLYSVGHYSRQMYFRWLIPEIFTQYNKVLYLDCDLVVNRNVAELYETDIHNNYIGAVNNFLRSNLENYVKNKLDLCVSQYYNSGVLLINTNEFICNRVKNKCLTALKTMDKLACPDQDVINLVCKGKIYRMDDSWNFQWHHQFPDTYKGVFLEDYEKRYMVLLEGTPAIIHYTSFLKPWKNPERPYADIFWHYCKATSFYEEILFKEISGKTLVEKENTLNGEKKKDISEETQEILLDLQYQLNEIRNSKSYKAGRILTFIPRLIRHIIWKKAM